MRSKLCERFGDNDNLCEQVSIKVWAFLRQLDVFNNAESNNSLMVYLNFQNEIKTAQFIKLPVIIPFCNADEIAPFRLFSFDELAAGTYGILEPKIELQKDGKRIAPFESIEVVIVPGLAFDMSGNRLGRGKGFYDKFIAQLPKTTITIAICCEFQIVEFIPVNALDKQVDIIVTENRIIYCR
ncbi:MAG: 5-formyltetrahydrofolate cyclo-ligase [Planctomycetaceae bacterium]|jgi:5-formyltetrahydrofolate cyclo-ligase|nr:5-formyltetrahydrofolate cyclo-ligase [Planctomycetaceae bacterium]